MEASKKSVAVVVALLLLVNVCCYAQTICNIPAAGLMECKPAVTLPNPTAPTNGCCTALSHGNMTCLCNYRNSKLLPSLGIDPNLAMQLPKKCNFPQQAHC